MIALALAAAVAASQPVEQAERAFAATAQTEGQWTAFRRFMAPGARILTDGPTDAAKFLAPLKDPRVALMWWPARTVTACDGSLAFSTGPWRSARGHGRFLTIWQRQPDGAWKWLYDGGGADDAGGSPAGDTVVATRAACGRLPPPPATPAMLAGGESQDGSLRWSVTKDGAAWRMRVLAAARGTWAIVADRIVGT
ncbi:hypothetical protein Q4F19_19520 [Sphingomonas sp. BIUV-7]|uniref:DUF4440 domain-containing protein n=1 Tax=Sphingomonas natans TaxID=3063330 RepID=A0ABT8YE06_9SPHN|nr:hypothetical protein [Sphingomonas sp. BIUV-7]MDO6416582.1 hypothetical protein [Sphingomonas sp. BIUV-7]